MANGNSQPACHGGVGGSLREGYKRLCHYTTAQCTDNPSSIVAILIDKLHSISHACARVLCAVAFLLILLLRNAPENKARVCYALTCTAPKPPTLKPLFRNALTQKERYRPHVC